MIIVCLVIIFLCLLVLHIYIHYNENRRTINAIPCPKGLPIIGNLLMVNVSTEKLWNLFIELLDKYYPIVRLWSGTFDVILIRHPDDIKTLLSCKNNIDKSGIVYSNFRSAGNDGLITNGGAKWRERRQFINPAFNKKMQKVYFEIMKEQTEQLVERMKSQSEEITLSLKSTFSKFTLAVVCEATMGVNPNKFGVEKEREFRHAFNQFGEIIISRVTRPYLRDWMMKFLSVGRKQERILKLGRVFINEIIQGKREYYEKIGYNKYRSVAEDDADDDSSSSVSTQKKRLCVLDLLLTAEKENMIDEKGVTEEVETMLIAGYDTAGVTMTFVFMLLAENKKEQELARKEVIELLDQTGGVLTIADINKLEYVERCIKETLRIFPSVPYIGRTITHNIKLSNIEIPHGTQVLMSIYSAHHDSNFWPDPEKFDPDRFLPENSKERHPFAYLPFSAGSRSCLGQKFAMMELKVMIAHILYNFYLEPIDLTANVKFKLHITLHTDECRVKLVKIHRESSA